MAELEELVANMDVGAGDIVCAPIAHDFNKKPRSLDVTVEGKDSEIDFSGLYLTEDIMNGLRSCGFQKPSPIQLRAIPLGRLGFDLLLQAKSGTGKTCVFSVIALENVTTATQDIQALILAPCREIAFQNTNVLKSLGVHKEGLCVKMFIGGKPMEKESRRIQLCHVAVGTPGRLAHLIRDYEMDLSNLRVFVLDEADKLLDASFYSDLQTIFDALPRNKQIIAASATYPDCMDEFILRFMSNPLKVQLDVSAPVLLAVDQFALNVKKMVDYKPREGKSLTQDELFRHKFKCLKEVLKRVVFTQAIIFSSFQLRAEKLYDELRTEDIDVVLLSAALDQTTRLDSLAQLQQGKCRLMVATDLVARGIDCESVDLVINFECPTELPTYIHRMGRAGRFGARGTVITFLVYSGEWSNICKFKALVNLKVSLIEDVKSLDTVSQQKYYSLNELSTKNKANTVKDQMGSTIGGVSSADIWEFCNRSRETLSLEEMTFQGIYINTDPQEIVQNVTEMKAMFQESMKRRLIEIEAEDKAKTEEFIRNEQSNYEADQDLTKNVIEQAIKNTKNLTCSEDDVKLITTNLQVSCPEPNKFRETPGVIPADFLDKDAKVGTSDVVPEVVPNVRRETRVLSSGIRGRGRCHGGRTPSDRMASRAQISHISQEESGVESSSMDEGSSSD